MCDEPTRLFFPGFAARTRAYAEALPRGWDACQPPPLHATGGSLLSLRSWAVNEIERRPCPAVLAGHSMGGALALLAAASVPERVHRLVLIAPACLPLQKPLRRSAADLVQQLISNTYPLRDVGAAVREIVAAPRGTVRLMRALRRLDLTAHMELVRVAGIPTVVVGCTTDTLVTPHHCRSSARLLAASYDEVALPGGHVWMFQRPVVLARLLRDTRSG